MNNKFLLPIKLLVAVILLTLINCGILVFSFTLPTGRMRQHVAESYPLIEAEHPYLQWDQGYTNSMMDFWSEYTEYGMAINEDSEGNAFEQAMFMRYLDTEGLPRDESVLKYAKFPEENFELAEYPRYWNGVVIFYKVLLLFFTIPDIRMINMFIQISLLCLIIYLMAKKGLENHILCLLAAILFINPVSMLMSLKFSAEYIPMLLAIITILLFGDVIDKVENGWLYFFTLLGSITSFFCMLSFPGVVLAIPLLVLIWKKNETDVVKTVISSSCLWSIAYGITWLMKWIICTLFTSYNLFNSVFEQMTYYEVSQKGDASVAERLSKNIWAYRNPAFYLLLASLGLLIILTAIIRNKKEPAKASSSERKFLDAFAGYILVALIPFVIFIVLGNGYAFVHAFMAHRQLAITAASSLCILQLICESIFRVKH